MMSSLGRWGMVVFLVGAAARSASACDIPIYKVAVQQWPRQPYALFYCTQKGLKANQRIEALLEGAFRSWLKSVNIDLIRIDVNRPMLEEDRQLMERRGIHPLPYAVLVDRRGRKLLGVSGRLDAERWRMLLRAARPIGPFEVLVFTSSRMSRAVVSPPPGSVPIRVRTVELDRADTAQRRLARRLGVSEFRLPHCVLLDGKGYPLRSHRGPLDGSTWKRFEEATHPTGPCRVVVFTKTELGSPLADPDAQPPLPVKVVDLDRADSEGRSLARRLKVVNLPFISVVSPRGTELANFGPQLGEGHLRDVVFSPKRTEIVRELKGKIAVLLFLHSRDHRRDRAALEIVKDGIRRGRRLFEGEIGLIEIDPTDQREEYLYRNLRIPRDGREAAVVAVFGKGKVLAVPPLKGKFSTNDVLDIVQIVMQGCSCVIQPSDLGEDLLLNWPEPKEKD